MSVIRMLYRRWRFCKAWRRLERQALALHDRQSAGLALLLAAVVCALTVALATPQPAAAGWTWDDRAGPVWVDDGTGAWGSVIDPGDDPPPVNCDRAWGS